jgi:hypothetical protein
MEPAKISFLFGQVPAWADPEDPDHQAALLSELVDEDDPESAAQVAVYLVLANQVMVGEPPEVWETAQRLLGLGLDRKDVLGQMAMVLEYEIMDGLDGGADDDGADDDGADDDGAGDDGADSNAAYMAGLATLPIPRPTKVSEAILAIVRELQPIDDDELLAKVSAAVDVPVGQLLHTSLMERVLDDLLNDEVLVYLTDDRVVEPATFCSGAILTHRLSDAEVVGDYIEIGADVCFAEPEAREGPGGEEIVEAWRDGPGLVWEMAKGLEGLPAGTMVAAKSTNGGKLVQVGVLEVAPPVDDAVVSAVLGVYELMTAETELPVSTQELVLEILANDRRFFDQPRAPLSEVVEACGLERRGNKVADGPQVWRNARHIRQLSRVLRRHRHERAERVLKVLQLANSGEWDDVGKLREAMATMKEYSGVAEGVAEELVGGAPDDDDGFMEDDAEPVEPFATRLLEVARTPSEKAVAHWLLARAAESGGNLLAAEARLHLAVETGAGWPPAVDRLAWYLSDKGEAAEAAQLWRSIGANRAERELMAAEEFAQRPGNKLGRNEPCWCGSGRKYKLCHLGEPMTAPLPDRVGWLATKAISYLKRHTSRAAPDILVVGQARVDGDTSEDWTTRAFADPLTLDLVLTEGGWFERFLAERGSILPADEAILATTWAMVDRTIYEVVTARPGHSVTVNDLRSAEEIEVRERSFSHQAVPGQMVCARAVPDGEGHQFVGAVFEVRAGTEAGLLDILDEGDPEAIAAWVARSERPPVMNTREGEAVVFCQAVLDVPDPDTAPQILDGLYEASETGTTWREMFQLNEDDRILRATLHLDGPRLKVDTTSEERMDRVLATLKGAIPRLKVVSDDRQPLDLAEMRRSIDAGEVAGADPLAGGAPPSPIAVPADVREHFQDMFERRWCDEEVPALAGLTPRQAAADPSRRESLERLLSEFERMDANLPEDGITMRPARLREMLGLV